MTVSASAALTHFCGLMLSESSMVLVNLDLIAAMSDLLRAQVRFNK